MEADPKRAKLGMDAVDEAVAYLKKQTDIKPLIGIICGSGLGGLADKVENPTTVEYKNIPNFAVSTVKGHAGKLVFGTVGGAPVVIMKGRLHCYEGYAFSRIAVPIRTMCKLGISHLLVTNAAGGLNSDYKVGDLMILNDHINFPGFAAQNPLVGPHDERYGQRFVPMSRPYYKPIRDLMAESAKGQSVSCIFVHPSTHDDWLSCGFAYQNAHTNIACHKVGSARH
eukprot:TRINITY_DN11532_c0_g2_i2.p2 TRINITY_DN11532_c0_g2~~TRINITY_DN11532_c0_g2_i2.p2  ORF type:complete len:226 (+),score=27.52 TRINITY_DN11532_c0_g2_i2:48-725(+)